MSPIGVMILVNPAALFLAIGTAMLLTGMTWLLYLRKLSRKHGVIAATVMFILSIILYAILIQSALDAPMISIETIRTL